MEGWSGSSLPQLAGEWIGDLNLLDYKPPRGDWRHAHEDLGIG